MTGADLLTAIAKGMNANPADVLNAACVEADIGLLPAAGSDNWSTADVAAALMTVAVGCYRHTMAGPVSTTAAVPSAATFLDAPIVAGRLEDYPHDIDMFEFGDTIYLEPFLGMGLGEALALLVDGMASSRDRLVDAPRFHKMALTAASGAPMAWLEVEYIHADGSRARAGLSFGGLWHAEPAGRIALSVVPSALEPLRHALRAHVLAPRFQAASIAPDGQQFAHSNVVGSFGGPISKAEGEQPCAGMAIGDNVLMFPNQFGTSRTVH